jgi:hypothetical protein
MLAIWRLRPFGWLKKPMRLRPANWDDQQQSSRDTRSTLACFSGSPCALFAPAIEYALALDDRPTKRCGPLVEGAAIHRNATPGPAGKVLIWPRVGDARLGRAPSALGCRRLATLGVVLMPYLQRGVTPGMRGSLPLGPANMLWPTRTAWLVIQRQTARSCTIWRAAW